MPKISIIMPLYNSAEYLKESIESILHQTYTDWEFIIINEFGSEDGSREIVEEYAKADKRFILIQNNTRLGISESMNRGLDIAAGTYIARMDADDISLPQRFEKQVQYLENHPEIVMCGVKVEIFGSNPFEWKLETNTDKLSTDILFYSPSVHPTVMIKKAFLDKYHICYNKQYHASEDYDLFAQICQYGKIANLEEVLFRYRIMNNNATFKNNDIGMEIYSKVMKRQFQILGLEFDESDIRLLSPHYSVKNLKGDAVLEAVEHMALLLQKILIANEKTEKYNRKFLWKTLQKRFKETCDSTAWFCKNFDQNKVAMIYSHSVFCKEDFYEPTVTAFHNSVPKVTVLIPTFNSENYIMGTLWSILEQSYQNFEILIINEYGSDDDTCFITKMFHDKRIRIIQNTIKLGLAESLNLGIREAKGDYIARMDADDLCNPDRLRLQVEFLDKNQDYGICGSWQHHFGINTEWIHKCSVSYEDIQAELIFNCDLCHSTLMLRKEYFMEEHLFYDSSYAAEDYELWTRAVRKFKIANLPMVLGEYRVGKSNITAGKMDALSLESGQLAARNIEYYFGIKIPEEMIPLQSGWRNEFDTLPAKERKKALEKEKNILKKMWKSNQKNRKFDDHSLLKTINKRWHMYTNTLQIDGEICTLEELFQKYEYNHVNMMQLKSKISGISFKKLIKRILWKPYYSLKVRTFDKVMQSVWDADGHSYDYYTKIMQECYDIDGHNYDYYVKLMQECHDIHRFIEGANKKQSTDLETIISLWDTNRNEIVSLNKKLEVLERKIDEQSSEIVELEKEIERKLLKEENKIIQEITDKIQTTELSINNAFNKQFIKIEENITKIVDTRIWKAEQGINETTDARIWKAEQNINEITDARIWKAEQNINEITDARIWKVEQNINETTDARIWKAEQNINEMTDARIWKAEQNINEMTDARIWKAEQNINEKMDARTWKAEQNINKITDARIWKAEQSINETADMQICKTEQSIKEIINTQIYKAEQSIKETIDTRVWKAELEINREILSQFWNLNREKVIDMLKETEQNDSEYVYNNFFYEDNQYGSFMSAIQVFKQIQPILQANSLIDFGCGTGTWLAVGKQYGIKNVLGIDGDYVNRKMLLIKNDEFVARDLSKPFNMNMQFDLAISLEVAEHIEEKYADTFVNTICNHSKVVLFSAAHPNQGGDGHINEKEIDYWREKFMNNGYGFVDIRNKFKDNYKIESWYKENMNLYIYKDEGQIIERIKKNGFQICFEVNIN